MSKVEQYLGTGRRKTAVARVRLKLGSGSFVINGKTSEEFIGNRKTLISMVNAPLRTLELDQKYDVFVTTHGGGVHSQIGAVRHGLARALVTLSEDYRSPLKAAGFLTRDPREKERKKYGQKRARKKFQFSKR